MKGLGKKVNNSWLAYSNNILASWLLNPKWTWVLISYVLEEGKQAVITQRI